MKKKIDQMLGLGAALVASALLLVVYPADQTPAPTEPTPVALAWPHAQSATVGTTLPDGTAFQPQTFLDARTSVGTAPDPEQHALRLVLRGTGTPVRELRRLPLDVTPWFRNFTVADDVLAWVEGTNGGHLELWTVNLRDGQPARQLTADVGNAILDGSQYDLLITGGRLYWAAGNPDARDSTEIRSVALTGGPVDIRTEPGVWQLSAWPWLVNGLGDQDGATALRNMITNSDLAVAGTGRRITRCSPTWCHVVSSFGDGYRTELVHPDGSARESVASGPALPAIVEVAPLDRFVVLSRVDSYSDLTATRVLLVFEIATRRTVEVSRGARAVSYGGGVLWWSTGTQSDPVWHALDLRTV